MSNFDLRLDRWSKIAAVLTGLFAVGFPAYLYFYLDVPNHKLNVADKCLNWVKETESKTNNGSTKTLETAQRNIKEFCSDKDKQDLAINLANTNFALKAELVAAQETIEELNLKVRPPSGSVTKPVISLIGYVSLGLAARDQYPKTNFRNVETDEKALKTLIDLKKGTLLKARWSVNLRTNNEDTERGNNPSLAIIRDNECVKMEEDLPNKPLRGSYWVKVSLAQCN